MAKDFYAVLLDDLNPAELDLRYLSHVTIYSKGQARKLSGSAMERFIQGSVEFRDVDDHSFAVNWATILYDTEQAWWLIKAQAYALLDRDDDEIKRA